MVKFRRGEPVENTKLVNFLDRSGWSKQSQSREVHVMQALNTQCLAAYRGKFYQMQCVFVVGPNCPRVIMFVPTGPQSNL